LAVFSLLTRSRSSHSGLHGRETHKKPVVFANLAAYTLFT
jgi:hypothetical protein